MCGEYYAVFFYKKTLVILSLIKNFLSNFLNMASWSPFILIENASTLIYFQETEKIRK